MPKKNGPPSKKAFVLSLPRDMPAKDVMERAKAVGLELTPNYVYLIRSAPRPPAKTSKQPPVGAPTSRSSAATGTDTVPAPIAPQKQAGAPKPVAQKHGPGVPPVSPTVNAMAKERRAKGPTPKPTLPTTSANEASFRRMVLDLGLGRARQVVDEIERKLAEIVGR